MKKIAFGFPLLLAVLPYPAQANEAVANSSLHLLAAIFNWRKSVC
ncbi:hypothetical protein RPM93_22525 [Salmonella enterica subsp. enterica serovar Oranienburg]